jgi:hypothetical protein
MNAAWFFRGRPPAVAIRNGLTHGKPHGSSVTEQPHFVASLT